MREPIAGALICRLYPTPTAPVPTMLRVALQRGVARAGRRAVQLCAHLRPARGTQVVLVPTLQTSAGLIVRASTTASAGGRERPWAGWRAVAAGVVGVAAAYGAGSIAIKSTGHATERSGDSAAEPGAALRRARNRNPTEVSDCERLGLMTPSVAQHTRVVLLKGFLSPDEVGDVVGAIESLQRSHAAAQIERNHRGDLAPNGVWRTSYLHTEGHAFRAMPGLIARLREAMEDADKSEGWGLVSARPSDRVNFRTVECHECVLAHSVCS